jgi:hypothetical protein
MKTIKALLPKDVGDQTIIKPEDFDEIDQGVKSEENAAPAQPNYTKKIVAPNKAK